SRIDNQRPDLSVLIAIAVGGPGSAAIDRFPYSDKWNRYIKHRAVRRIDCDLKSDESRVASYVRPVTAAIHSFEDAGSGGGVDTVVCFIDGDAMDRRRERKSQTTIGPGCGRISALENAAVCGGVKCSRCVWIDDEIIDYVSVVNEHETPGCARVDRSEHRAAEGRRVKSGRCNRIDYNLTAISTEAVIDGCEVVATVSAFEHASGCSGIDDRRVCWLDGERVDGELRCTGQWSPVRSAVRRFEHAVIGGGVDD